MPFVGEIGEIFKPDGEKTVEWKIPDFFSLSVETDSYYQSPFFYFLNSKWRLRLYPNGETRTVSPGWIGLCLVNVDSGSPVRLIFGFSVKEPENVKSKEFSNAIMNKTEIKKGPFNFIQRSELIPLQLPVPLLVSCWLRCEDLYTCQGNFSDRLLNLSQNFKAIQNMEKYSDYTVKIENREFYCHRAILASRCPYFARLLDSDVMENDKSEVKISDIEASVFELVLSYIYCGDFDDMSTETVCKIYLAADKLFLQRLKRVCADFIKKNIDIDIVCEVISTAKLCDDGELEECALDYFIRHTDDVLKSQEWKEFQQEESPRFVIEVLEKILRKK